MRRRDWLSSALFGHCLLLMACGGCGNAAPSAQGAAGASGGAAGSAGKGLAGKSGAAGTTAGGGAGGGPAGGAGAAGDTAWGPPATGAGVAPAGWRRWQGLGSTLPVYLPPPGWAASGGWEPCAGETVAGCQALKFPDLGQGPILGPVEMDIAWYTGTDELMSVTYVVGDAQASKGRYAVLLDAPTGNIRWIAATDYSDESMAIVLIAQDQGYLATSFLTDKRFGWFGSAVSEGATPYVGVNQPYSAFSDAFHGPGKWVVQSSTGRIKVQPVVGGQSKVVVEKGLVGDAFRDPYIGRSIGDAVLVSFAPNGPVKGLGVWTPLDGYVNVLDWPDASFGALNVGTDGASWVWTEGSDYNQGSYATRVLRTAPYSLDAGSVAGSAKSLRKLTGYGLPGNNPWVVGCGRAALRVTKSNGEGAVWVVRLTDGMRWSLPVGFGNPYALTCDEILVTHWSPTRYLARVPLASLGSGEATDL